MKVVVYTTRIVTSRIFRISIFLLHYVVYTCTTVEFANN